MGTDKALLLVDGRPMVVRVADALRAGGCTPIECQGGDGARLAELGIAVVPDESVGAGPVPAVAQIVGRHAGTVVIAACDLPELDGISVEAVARPVDEGAIAAVAVADGQHLLLAIRGGSEVAAACRDAGARSFRGLLAALGAVEVPVEASVVRNVNRPDDLG